MQGLGWPMSGAWDYLRMGKPLPLHPRVMPRYLIAQAKITTKQGNPSFIHPALLDRSHLAALMTL